MSLNSLMSALSIAEFLLWAGFAFLFWKRKLQRRFPALGVYLALHVVGTPFLVVALYVQSTSWGRGLYPLYFYPFWAVYIASAVLLFFVCVEVFRSALTPFPGLVRLGVVAFRWAALVSVILTFSTLSFRHPGILIIPEIAFRLMRSVSILELCLLGFLCLSMNTLRLSVRDFSFGVALGFGLLSANDFIGASLAVWNTSLTAPLQFVYQSLVLVSLGIWVAYAALPEPVRKPIVLPANSTIYRWNEIAVALGHPATHVAARQTTDSFFLTDVEKVVEKVLTKNFKNRKSEI